jgi:hypothetical protein
LQLSRHNKNSKGGSAMTDSNSAVVPLTGEREGEGSGSEIATTGEGSLLIDALPEPIAQFATACAASLSAPVELVAIPALVVAAGAIGNSRVIRLKPDWTEPASLFAAVVSPSGAMKSPALNMAAKPLQDLDLPTGRTWTADVTVEQLARLMAANPRGLLLVRDELSAWVKTMNQYRQGKGADRQFYLSVWGGAPVKVDRVGAGTPTSITVPHPCLSVVGCIPPDVIPNLDDQSGQEDGFLPRLLFSWPEPMQVRWSNQVITVGVRDRYASLIKDLFALPYGGEPVCLSLTAAAQARFIQWHDEHCDGMEQSGLPPFLRAVFAKLKGYCARLALIHALAINPQTERVDLESVEAAIRITGYFKAQARKVMPLLGENKSSEVERCKAEIKRKLSVSRYMKKRDIQKSSAFDAEVFNKAFAEMTAPHLVVDAEGGVRLWEPTNRQMTS